MTTMKTMKGSGILLMALIFAAVSLFAFSGSVQAKSIKYLDDKGNEQTRDCATLPDGNNIEIAGGWYYVPTGETKETFTIDITTGDCHLVLADKSVLKMVCFTVPEGTSLTIYAQSKEETKMGALEAVNTGFTGAAIGGPSGENAGDITINGGKISAQVEGRDGAAIGGGIDKAAGKVTINGGVVVAKTDRVGAAIGTGANGTSGEVVITGGKVTAECSGPMGVSGAAIGSGRRDVGDDNETVGVTVTIKGGEVNATNDGQGAAIGGGGNVGYSTGNQRDKVIINGGKVTAVNTGNSINKGAGIGSGCDGGGCAVTINGGVVTAASSAAASGAAAIGGGYRGSKNGKVTINGGEIDASRGFIGTDTNPGVGNGCAVELNWSVGAKDSVKNARFYAADTTVTLKKAFVFSGDLTKLASPTNLNYHVWNNKDPFTLYPAYQVSFNANGGSTVAPVGVRADGKTTAIRPADPTRDDDVFKEWRRNGAAYTFSEAVKANLTLDAFWLMAISPEVKLADWFYGEAPQEPSLTGNTGNGAVKYDYKPIDGEIYSDTVPTAAGQYTVRATIAETANYAGNTATDTFLIKRAPIAPEVTIEDWTYGEAAKTPALTGNPGDGTVKYEYKAADAGEDAYKEEVPENAGQYTLRAMVAATDNYEGNTATTDFEIKKAPITPEVTIEAWTYGEAAKTPALTGNTDNGEVKYEYKPAAAGEDAYKEEVPENAGQYTLRATVAATANYAGNTATTDFEIKKAPITPEVAIEDWTYGETASTPELTGNTDNGTVKYEYKVEDAEDAAYKEEVPTAAGKYTLRATVAATDNYEGGTATTTFEIIPAVVIPVTENGSITLEPPGAQPGETVKVIPAPAENYDVQIAVTDADDREIPVTKEDDGTFTFTMPKNKVTVKATFTQCPGHTFTDVDRKAWYHDCVDYVVEKGLMKGITATTFEPETATSRAMLVMTLYRLAGEQEISGKSPFKDVKDNSWYGKAVIWAYENKIVDGYGGGKFGPNDPVTREQLVTIFYRYSGKMGYDVTARGDLSQFSDVDTISGYAKDAMSWAVGVNLIEGMGDNTVAPKNDSTRAQIAAILTRFCENLMK